MVNKHVKFFRDLDALLATQEAENARLHEEVDKNWLDNPEVDEAQLVWDAFNPDTPDK